MRTLTALATTTILALAAESAVAQVYKCTVGGRQVYQSKPCTAGDKPVKIYSHPKADGPARSMGDNSVREYLDLREEKQRRAESVVDRRAREAKENRLARERAEAEKHRLDRAVMNDQVLPGMSKQQVRSSWGSPDDVNTTTSSYGGKTEQWVYEHDDGWDYVHFNNSGVVTSVNEYADK